jgi:uncharacterized membrane protein
MFLDLLVLSVDMLMAGDPTKKTLALRILSVYFATKADRYQLPLSGGFVPSLCKNSCF